MQIAKDFLPGCLHLGIPGVSPEANRILGVALPALTIGSAFYATGPILGAAAVLGWGALWAYHGCAGAEADFVGVSALIATQAKQLESFETWAREGCFGEFRSHHYDWWMFPIDRKAAGTGGGIYRLCQ